MPLKPLQTETAPRCHIPLSMLCLNNNELFIHVSQHVPCYFVTGNTIGGRWRTGPLEQQISESGTGPPKNGVFPAI